MNSDKSANTNKIFDLQQRLVSYAVSVIKMTDKLPSSLIGRHIASQILRSSTSPAANYAEAQGAESNADFIHKLKIALKELRETNIWLMIIEQAQILHDSKIKSIMDETSQLTAIIFKSIETASKRTIK